MTISTPTFPRRAPVRRRRARPVSCCLTASEEAQVIEMLKRTKLSQSAIAAAIGVNQGRIAEVNKQHGCRLGRAAKKVRMTAALAAEVKRLLKHTQLAQHQIAASLSINQGRVSEIATGKKWGHITP